MRLGLHVDAQLVLVGATGDGPLQRGKRGHGNAEGAQGHRRQVKHVPGLGSSWVLSARWQLYLQMLETTGLGHIGGMTKKGSAALVFMSWSDDTT